MGGADTRGQSSRGDECVAGGGRLTCCRPPQASPSGVGKATLLPATQQAGPGLTYQNKNPPFNSHGNRRWQEPYWDGVPRTPVSSSNTASPITYPPLGMVPDRANQQLR